MLQLIFRNYSNEVKNSNSGITSESTEKTKSLFVRVGWIMRSVSFDRNIGDFGLKWPPI